MLLLEKCLCERDVPASADCGVFGELFDASFGVGLGTSRGDDFDVGFGTSLGDGFGVCFGTSLDAGSGVSFCDNLGDFLSILPSGDLVLPSIGDLFLSSSGDLALSSLGNLVLSSSGDLVISSGSCVGDSFRGVSCAFRRMPLSY